MSETPEKTGGGMNHQNGDEPLVSGSPSVTQVQGQEFNPSSLKEMAEAVSKNLAQGQASSQSEIQELEKLEKDEVREAGYRHVQESSNSTDLEFNSIATEDTGNGIEVVKDMLELNNEGHKSTLMVDPQDGHGPSTMTERNGHPILAELTGHANVIDANNEIEALEITREVGNENDQEPSNSMDGADSTLTERHTAVIHVKGMGMISQKDQGKTSHANDENEQLQGLSPIVSGHSISPESYITSIEVKGPTDTTVREILPFPSQFIIGVDTAGEILTPIEHRIIDLHSVLRSEHFNLVLQPLAPRVIFDCSPLEHFKAAFLDFKANHGVWLIKHSWNKEFLYMLTPVGLSLAATRNSVLSLIEMFKEVVSHLKDIKYMLENESAPQPKIEEQQEQAVVIPVPEISQGETQATQAEEQGEETTPERLQRRTTSRNFLSRAMDFLLCRNRQDQDDFTPERVEIEMERMDAPPQDVAIVSEHVFMKQSQSLEPNLHGAEIEEQVNIEGYENLGMCGDDEGLEGHVPQVISPTEMISLQQESIPVAQPNTSSISGEENSGAAVDLDLPVDEEMDSNWMHDWKEFTKKLETFNNSILFEAEAMERAFVVNILFGFENFETVGDVLAKVGRDLLQNLDNHGDLDQSVQMETVQEISKIFESSRNSLRILKIIHEILDSECKLFKEINSIVLKFSRKRVGNITQ